MPVFTLAIIILILGVSAPLHAAKFHCSSGDVTCLIASINKANRSKGPHTIFLDPGTYTLTQVDNDTGGSNGLPSIKSKITIESDPPNAVTVERDLAAPGFRIFHISEGGELALRFIRIKHGSHPFSGATILNGGKLTLFGVVVREVSGNGSNILNLGDLEIFQSSIEDNVLPGHDGIIANSGNATMTISQSSIKRNSNIGPVIGNGFPNLVGGTVIIRDSAITENRVDLTVIDNTGNLTVMNTTIGNNQTSLSPGVVSTSSGGVTSLLNSTISRNVARFFGSGIGNSGGTVRLKNTLVALNTRSNGTVIEDCFGEIVSLGNNFIGNTTDAECINSLQPSDLTGDPRLGALTDGGDPGLAHFQLLSDSPAIGAADPAACPQTDQLGFFRVATCDIGAVEFQPGPLTLVLDFQPNDPNNTIKLTSSSKMNVAILGSASFDARAIDPETVRFGPNQAVDTNGKGKYKDVNRDGFDDLVLGFTVADSGIQCGDTSVSISGETFSGQAIQGTDFIQTVKCP